MSSFSLPPLKDFANQANPWAVAAGLTAMQGAYYETPQARTKRDLDKILRFTPEEDASFGTKLYNAFTEETVTGQFISSLGDPTFADTGYYPDKDDIKKYAGDLPEYMVERIVEETSSFEQFLYEIDQARTTVKKRSELYSSVGGFGLGLLAAGGEATMAALLLGAATGGAGAPSGAAAVGSTAAQISQRALRIKGALRAVGAATAVDLPLETLRYKLDKTLTPGDLLIAMGASVSLSAGLGAWKPEKFIRGLSDMSNHAKLQQAADYAAANGDLESARVLNEVTKGRIRIRPLLDPDDPAEEVMTMSYKELVEAAKKEGIKVETDMFSMAVRTRDDLKMQAARREAIENNESVVYRVGRKRARVKKAQQNKLPLNEEAERQLATLENPTVESATRARAVNEILSIDDEIDRVRVGYDAALEEAAEELSLKTARATALNDKLAELQATFQKADASFDQRALDELEYLEKAATRADMEVAEIEDVIQKTRLEKAKFEENPTAYIDVTEGKFNQVKSTLNVLRGIDDDEDAIIEVLTDLKKRRQGVEFQSGEGRDLDIDAMIKEAEKRKKQKLADLQKAADERQKKLIDIKKKINQSRNKAQRDRLRRDFKKRLNEPAENIAPRLREEAAEARYIRQYEEVRGKMPRDMAQIQEELIDARRAKAMKQKLKAEESTALQVRRKWESLDSTAKKRRYAAFFGIRPNQMKKLSDDKLLELVQSKALVAARRGFSVTGDVGKPKGIKFASTVTFNGVKVSLTSNIEKMLYKLGTARGKNAKGVKSVISQYLKKRGVQDPEGLSEEFIGRIRSDLKARPSTKNYRADMSKMRLEKAVRVQEDGIVFRPDFDEPFFGTPRELDFKVDEDIIEGTNFRKSELDGDDISDLESRPLSEQEETVITDDRGEPLATGPSEFVEPDMARLSQDIPEQGATSGASQGIREYLARKIDRFGDLPFGLNKIPFVGKLLYRAFTPLFDRFMDSKSKDVRKFASVFLDSPRGTGASSVMAIARTNFDRVVGDLAESLNVARAAARKKGVTLNDRDIIRMVRDGMTPDGPEGMAVKAVRDYFKKILKYAKDNGLPVEGIPDSPNYFPRAWNPSKYAKVIDMLGKGDYKAGKEKLTEFLANAIRSGRRGQQTKLSKKASRKVADRIVEYLDDPGAKRDWNTTIKTLDRVKQNLIRDLEEIQDDVVKEAGGITALADDLMGIIAPKVDQQPHISFGRRRIDLDESYAEQIDGMHVHIDDLMDMDLNLVTRRYAQQAIGAVSARKGAEAAFGTADITLTEMQSRIAKSAREAGDDAKTVEMYQKMMGIAYRTLTGQQVYSKEAMKWAQVSNMLAQGTMGMTLGFAQVPEIANIFYRTSFKAAATQFNFKDIRKTFFMGLSRSRMRNEVDELSSCLETYTGIAGDYSRGDHFMRRMDDIGFDDDYLNNSWWGRYLDTGRLVSSLNPLGIMPMDTFMRRWAARASFQHFVNTAFEVGPDGVVKLSRGWWKNSAERFGQLGMGEDDIARLTKVLRNPDFVTYQKGMFGSYKAKNFDFSKVEDKAIVDKFIMALRRNTDSMVQRQTLGEMPTWMNTEFGKVLSQFRVFTVVAKSKQLAAGVARGDAVEVGNVLAGSALAMLGYYGVTYYRSLGQADPETYWNEKTTQERLIKSAIMRSGYATILPALIDPVFKFATGEGLFDSSLRTTGQSVDPLFGATVMTNIQRLKESGGTILDRLFQDRDFTQRDLKNLMSLVWVTKLPALDQLIQNHFVNKAPVSNR